MREARAAYTVAEVGVMKRFEKTPLGIKTETVIRKYDSFQMVDALEKDGAFPIKDAYNCDITDGTARVGIGASVYTLSSGKFVLYDWSLSAPKAFFYYGEQLGFLSDENKLYFYEERTKTYRLAHTFEGEMKVVETQDDSGAYYVCFCGEAGVFSYDTYEGAKTLSDFECLPVACNFQGRIFIAAADSLLYSSPFSAGDMSECMDGNGSIVLPSDTGHIVDLAATSNTLFVFCEYGIWKLTSAGSVRDFRLEKVGFTGNGILKGSACAVAFSGGEKVFFFDKYGPWKLDRSGTVRICSDFNFLLRPTEQVCEHAYLNGKVVYNYRALDNSVMNVVIDAETDRAYRSFTAQGLTNLKGQAVGVVDGLVYALEAESALPSGRIFELIAPEYDFHLSGVKTLRRLKLFGEGTITLSVSNGRKTKKFTLKPENGVANVDVRLKGEFFLLRFIFAEKSILRGLDAELCRLVGTR